MYFTLLEIRVKIKISQKKALNKNAHLENKISLHKNKKSHNKNKNEFFIQYVIVNCIDFRYRDLVVKTITDGFARGDDHVQCLFIGEHGKPF